MTHPHSFRLCDSEEAIGVSPDTIRTWEKKGLPVIRTSIRAAFVRYADADAFMAKLDAARRAASEAQSGGKLRGRKRPEK